MSLLELNDLTVAYETQEGPLPAVDDVNLSLQDGEILGVVGESGSGKSTLAKAILRILDENGSVTEGEIRFDGTDLTTISRKELNGIRWSEISYIAQNAMNALDPVYRVGSQVVEVIRAHTDQSKAEARERTAELFRNVGLDPSRRRDYPHELSGGQRQRVVIALALALGPSIVLADECTTGLDVVVQDAILELLSDIQSETGNSMLFITHDMSTVAEIADRVAVMYGGKIVEVGPTSDVFKRSAHPYTIGLRNAFPTLEAAQRDSELITIPGDPPDLRDEGVRNRCRFADRCPFATERCEEVPEFVELSDGHEAKCHYAGEAADFRERGTAAETWRERP